jgi:hypothetical protein
MTVSKSPDRFTFQRDAYFERCITEGTEPNHAYIEMFATQQTKHDVRFENPETRENNLEFDLLTTSWILEKVRSSKSYSQHIYAALCNNEFQKLSVIPILTDERWGCSWRYAGGIVADMRQEGDYIDWYCSGIRNTSYDEENTQIEDSYVPEGQITAEIREDLQKLGWIVAPGGDWENFD